MTPPEWQALCDRVVRLYALSRHDARGRDAWRMFCFWLEQMVAKHQGRLPQVSRFPVSDVTAARWFRLEPSWSPTEKAQYRARWREARRQAAARGAR
jgi:hypothetical protein